MDFLMGDVGKDSLLQLPISRESKSFENFSVDRKGNFSPIELDHVLLKKKKLTLLNSPCYMLTYSQNVQKNIVSWVEKKLNLELASTRNIVKLIEATRTNIGLQEFIPLQSLFTGALLNGIRIVTFYKKELQLSKSTICTASTGEEK
ncbi:hypothetical protein H1C71_009242 [Ictidomys tridecemlineatus]|nr:hypothetical protein H1C71_009242 [Ictidomys tridecemlineatus]